MTAKEWGLPPVTVRVQGAPAEVGVQMLAEAMGVSVVVPDLEGATITFEFRGTPGQSAAEFIADRLGLGVSYRDGVLHFSKAESSSGDDVAVIVPGYSSPDDTAQGLRSVLAQGAMVGVVGSRVVVRGDSDQIRMAADVIGELEVGPDGWMFQIDVVRVDERLRRELGLSMSAGGVARLGVDADDGRVDADAGLNAALEGVFQAAASGNYADVIWSGSVFVLEGERGVLQQGDVVAVPRRQTSPEGTVTVVGIDQVETGFKLDLAARRVDRGVLLDLRSELSSVTGFIEGFPQLSQSLVQSSIVVDSGETIVLSGLRTVAARGDGSGIVSSLGITDDERSGVLVIVTATRTFAGGRL